ncbi:MAG TPA: hypothetical protein VH277_02790 [Gemmatimonadaceae bacterium]|nr:hypothetical protein [Gemmatimonadaceae bacterium]
MLLGTLGKREVDEGGENPQLSADERPIVRRQVRRVVVQSLLIAGVVALVLAFLPV